MKSIAKKEFTQYLSEKSDSDKSLFVDFFYEGVLEYRKLGRRARFTDISPILESKIILHIDDIITDDNRLAKLLGFLYEYHCERIAPLYVGHTECVLLEQLFGKLKYVKNLNLNFYLQCYVSINDLLCGRKPHGFKEPQNPHLKEDCKKIISLLFT